MHVCSNIFSQSESCFAFCFDIAFCRADSLNLNGVLFTNHSFTGFVLCVTPRSHHNPKGIYIFFYVTLRGFIFLHFTFTSMIPFELTYMKDIVSMSRFTILHQNVQLFQHHQLIIIIFDSLYLFCFSVKDQLTIFIWVYVWSLDCVPLIYLSILSPLPYCLETTDL